MLNNNFNGGINIGSGNSAGRDQIINNYISSSSQEKQPIDKYDIEPPTSIVMRTQWVWQKKKICQNISRKKLSLWWWRKDREIWRSIDRIV